MNAQVDPYDLVSDPRWRLSNLYKITNKSGKAIPFEPNESQLRFLNDIHSQNIILKARQLGFCLDPNSRVLTASLDWKAIKDLSVGEDVVSVDEHVPGGRGSSRKMRTAIVEAVAVVKRVAYRVKLDDGTVLICTDRHPWLTRKVGTDAKWRSISGQGNNVVGKMEVGTKIRRITRPWSNAPSYSDGWFGGLLDGEGSLALPNSSGAELNVSQVDGAVFDETQRYLHERGYNYRIEVDVGERPSKFGSRPVNKLVVSRMEEMFRILGETKPKRFANRHFWEGKELPGKKIGNCWGVVTSIEKIGEQDMIDLQTSTGTYIAEGYVSHNTTLCCLIYLDACIFTPNTRAGVIAHKLDDAKVIFRDKIKFPYDNLDDGIKALVATRQDSADTLTLANNSSIRVSTSMRSGTLQYLHISEFGKICSQYPEKAREIVTGALNTVEAGQFVAIESTAEGQEGKFYEMVQDARAKVASGQMLSDLDYKYHFYPWWKDSSYRIPSANIFISQEDEDYFAKLKAEHGIEIDNEQRSWYVKKQEIQGGDMRREYPSTPDEAFEQALEGAYFSHEMLAASKQKRIGSFPYVPNAVVNTFWDLGRSDMNTIWLHQFHDGYHRFIGYYENSGEFIGHYVSWLREWAKERNATFGEHYIPHDGDRQSLWLEGGTLAVMDGLNFRPNIVERPNLKIESIASARAKLPLCVFDEKGCDMGLKRLRSYRKEWDDLRGVWKDKPRHDTASHGADGFQTFATSNYDPPKPLVQKSRYSGRGNTQSSGWMAS